VDLPRPRLAIPAKLLLVSSLLLLIPWVGFLYVRELERLLLRVQEQGLVSTARAVATALNDRPNVLLSGEVYSVPASPERDLRVPNLAKPIVADGRTADWEQEGTAPRVEGTSRPGTTASSSATRNGPSSGRATTFRSRW
jgi:hypothetical protein